MEFANPYYLWLLLIVPIMVVWYIFRQKNLLATIKTSNTGFLTEDKYALFRHSTIVIRTLAVLLIIIALARPQTSFSWQDVTTEGVDIVIAIDISGSMLAEDFRPNRLEASKQVAMDFIQGRPSDRFGLVIYGGESFTQCPLTTDHDVLLNLFKDIENGIVEDGTAIGLGLSTAVNRLKDSKAISKVAILLTDGSNNMGAIPPLTAAKIAEEFGVRVYTIGVGSNGMARTPFRDEYGRIHYANMPVRIDESTLKEIAKTTDGKYFRATNKKALEEIYKEIDKLEKSKIEVTQYKNKSEGFLLFASIALFLLLIEYTLNNTLFKRIV